MNRYFGVCFLWLLPSFIPAQVVMTLDSAVQEGLISNYRVLISNNEAEKNKQNITWGNAGFLPSVTAYGSYDRASFDARQSVVSGSELDNARASASFFNAGLKADWVLFDGSKMFVKYGQLQSAWKISDIESHITMENVVAGIISAYCDMIRQKELVTVCLQQLETSKLRMDIAEDRLNSGLGSRQEWLQAVVAMKADSNTLLLQEADYLKSGISLNRMLSANPSRTLTIEDTLRLSDLPSREFLKNRIFTSNNLIKLYTEKLAYSRSEEKILQSGHYPKVSLTGSYSYAETNTEAAFIKYNRFFGPQAGLSLSYPLFDGLRLKNAVQTAKINSENRELWLKDFMLEAEALFDETWLDYQSQLNTINLGRDRLTIARMNLDIAMNAYTSGAISSIEVREAQDALYEASADLIHALCNTRLKETELLKICGMLLK